MGRGLLVRPPVLADAAAPRLVANVLADVEPREPRERTRRRQDAAADQELLEPFTRRLEAERGGEGQRRRRDVEAAVELAVVEVQQRHLVVERPAAARAGVPRGGRERALIPIEIRLSPLHEVVEEALEVDLRLAGADVDHQALHDDPAAIAGKSTEPPTVAPP